MDPLFQHQQLRPLGLHHPRDGDAGPGADDFGDFLGPDLLAQQAAALALRLGRFGRLQLLGELLLLAGPARRAAGSLPRRPAGPSDCFSLIAAASWLNCSSTSARRLRIWWTSPSPSFSDSHCSRRLASLCFCCCDFLFDLGEPLLGVLFLLVGQLPGGQFELRPAAAAPRRSRSARSPAPSPAGWWPRPSGRSPCRAGSGR